MKDVRSVVSTMNDLGNPFDDDTNNLFALDTKVIMPQGSHQLLHFVSQKTPLPSMIQYPETTLICLNQAAVQPNLKERAN